MSAKAGDFFGDYGSQAQAQDDRFPDPFMDIASTYMPQSPAEMLRWCEFIAYSNNLYQQALVRIASYLITDVEIKAKGTDTINEDEKNKYSDFLKDTLGIQSTLVAVALDYLVYGNSFTSLLMPFTRCLSCKTPGCGFESPLTKVAAAKVMNYRWENFQFKAKCPNCKRDGVWNRVDRRSGETGNVKIKRWNVHEIDILWEPTREMSRYIWRIPELDRGEIKRGNLHYLEHTDWEIIEAVRTNQNLLFNRDAIYHMKRDALAGIRNRGWGLSPVLSNFRQAWYVQMLKRYNEAICLDYIVPVRVITPGVRAGATPETSDPYLSIGMGGFVSRIEHVLKKRRKDPCTWNVFPSPIDYHLLGGEANQLVPTDLLDQGQDDLLNGIGTPVDFYKGTLSVQAAPVALRLFEAHWSHLTHTLNKFLEKIMQQISKSFSWEPALCKLEKITHADDLNRQMAKLQLMMSGIASKTTGLKSVGMDYTEELNRSLEEQRMESEEQQRIQDEMEQSAQLKQNLTAPQGQPGAAPGAGGAAPAGAPPAGGGDPMNPLPAGAVAPPSAVQSFISQRVNNPDMPVTPQDLQDQASSIAQELQMKPDSQRRSEMTQLRQADETMADLVTQQLKKQRQQMRMQGGEMLMQQAKSGSLRGRSGAKRWTDLAQALV